MRRTEISRSLFLFVGSAAVIGSLGGCGGSDENKGAAAPPPSDSTAIATPQTTCSDFLGQTIEGATVTRAQVVPAANGVPERCTVLAQMPQDLQFEVNLPTSWNKRTVFLGGGGFDGSITRLPSGSNSPNIAARGFATIATNHGHTSANTQAWALDPEMLNEYAYLAVPRVLPAAKAIMQTYYGAQPVSSAKIIYEGCSGGGRQGLIQAQRFPKLFDGVISRAPANAYTPQFLWYQRTYKQLAKPGAALSTAKIKTISDAVYRRCDALDGVADRIVSRPDICQFDPAELKCSGAESDACLTDPQIDSARTFYAATNIANGSYTWPGFPYGGEEQQGTPTHMWGGAISKLLMDGFIKYFVAEDAMVDPLRLEPEHYTARLNQLVTMIDAVNPDLTQFRARGGKLILWTGLTDWLITANNATDYYTKVVTEAGGQAEADKFVEYFTAPGVNHCAGGTGADTVDLVGPMFNWIEKGVPPSQAGMVATQSTPLPNEKPVKRPLCKYPQYARYNGMGDPTENSSFTCVTP